MVEQLVQVNSLTMDKIQLSNITHYIEIKYRRYLLKKMKYNLDDGMMGKEDLDIKIEKAFN